MEEKQLLTGEDATLWHSLTTDATLSALKTSADEGLTGREVETRQTSYGYNELKEALPKGGTVTVKAGDSENQTRVTATGDGAALRDYMEEALSHLLPVEDLDPRLVHPYVLAALAKDYGFTVNIAEETEGQVAFLLAA